MRTERDERYVIAKTGIWREARVKRWELLVIILVRIFKGIY
jgi:hypothetical protein